MSNKNLVGTFVRRLSMVPPKVAPKNGEDPIDHHPREVVDFADPAEGIQAPGSVRIRGVGWWPADRVLR